MPINATNLRPFRDVDQHEVINLFALSTQTGVKGQFVKISTGWTNDDQLSLNNPAGATFNNTVSPRWANPARVTVCGSTGDGPAIGMLLYDVLETDENGEKLLFHPDKAARLQAVPSGKTVPILTRGIIMYSGVAGNPTGGNTLYVNDNGTLTCTGFYAAAVALGSKDSHGYVPIAIKL